MKFQSDVGSRTDILKLGLLHGFDDNEVTLDDEPEWLTYSHKLFQDYLAGYYASKRGRVSSIVQNVIHYNVVDLTFLLM